MAGQVGQVAGQGPYEAVKAPRLHCSLDGTVSLEAARMSDAIVETLAGHGFKIKVCDPYSFYLGCVQLVMRNRDGWRGVANPRRDGSAGGPHYPRPCSRTALGSS
jgi:gamma-glutamyltranspeptidase/glutathione hydrolase